MSKGAVSTGEAGSRGAVRKRLNYYQRIFSAYLTGQRSQLTFWHEDPQPNPNFLPDKLGEYYMPFASKADYPGLYDAAGVPMLDYQGAIGPQYNPIAIAQYGLGNYNLLLQTGQSDRRRKALLAADWLVGNLQKNQQGIPVWQHQFDWEYRTTLIAPWYSGLAQGQGISLLVRAFKETGNANYLISARLALEAFKSPVSEGGVAYTDVEGHLWFEEYIVHPKPPTHILNGFIWGSWGLYDLWLTTGDAGAHKLWSEALRTLSSHLQDFDTGYWSLYEQSGTRMKMLASPFYHRLHIAQLTVMHRLTGEAVYSHYAARWEAYWQSWHKRNYALAYKAIFKLLYY